MEPLRGIGVSPRKVAREESLAGAPGYRMKAFLIIEKRLLHFLGAERRQPAIGYRRGRHHLLLLSAPACVEAMARSLFNGTVPARSNRPRRWSSFRHRK